MNTSLPENTPLKRVTSARRAVAGVLACLILFSVPGCYGRFPLTNALYDWNGRVTDNHIVNSIIMIILGIFPVYGLAILIDAIIINSIEYWDGSRVEITQTYQQPDGTTVVFGPGATEKDAVLSVYREEVLIAQRLFSRDDAGMTTIRDENGTVVSHVIPDGMKGFLFTDANHEPLGALTSDQIASLRAKQGKGADNVMTFAAFPPTIN